MPIPRAGNCYPALVLAGLLGALWASAPLAAQEGEAESPGDSDLPLEAPGITVTASPETTQQIKVITRETIEAAHAPDLATLLQETLNLGLTRYGPYGSQADISLRGFDSERIAFLINGVPVNSPVSGDFELSMIGLSSVDRIEVIYGGSDSKYNVTGALGGVVNIITVREGEQGLRIEGSLSNSSSLPGEYYKPGAGSRNPQWQDLADGQSAALSLGLGTENRSWSAGLFANRAGNHFLFEDYYGRTLRREANEVWDTGASLSLVQKLPRDAKLIAGGDLYYGDRNIPLSGIAAEAEKQRDFSTRQNLMLDMPQALRDDLSAEASLSYAWRSLSHGDSSRHSFHTLTAINRWGWYPLSWLTLRLGGDYRLSVLESTDMGRHDRQDGGLYAGAEIQTPGQLLVIPSIKAVFSGSGAAPVTAVPKLGILWAPAPSLTLKNNYFRGFKLPDFEDLYWAGGGMRGNQDLKPEDGWGADLGAAWNIRDRINIEGTFFTQWTADSIHWYSSSGTWRPENVGEAVFFGLDLMPRLEIPLPAGRAGRLETIGLSLSYQYLLSYLLSYGYSYSSDKRIPYMPLHSAGFSIDIPWKLPSRQPAAALEGSLKLSGHYESPRYADTANLTRIAPYFLLNLGLNQALSRNITAFVVFRNLLNQSYESFNDYYMPGLGITAGFRGRFQKSPPPNS
jgi:outer membrane cobalamin receptor